MPKRTDIKSILIIGAGPILIGPACEFDYSGVQACKALREEGYRLILVNSNPATIMTDPDMADATYIEPITWEAVGRVIAKELPDAILPTMGGETALNCAHDLYRHGILEKYRCQLLGVTAESLEKIENPTKFKVAMSQIGLTTVRSGVARSMAEAWAVQEELGFPVIIRSSSMTGLSGDGAAKNSEQFHAICKREFEESEVAELLIEESLIGWKELEMEVVRDRNDHCLIVCSIENFDPMGVHSGDSITVAPAQTLTEKQSQMMRDASIAIMREIGINTGGSNVRFAMNPDDGHMVVIEMNPGVSRSSALASKATGIPIARFSAKLAVGFTLQELQNEIGDTPTAASLDLNVSHVVTRMPRFAFEKFPMVDDRLTAQMKSVGEVMTIGRTFQESFQKALRALETGLDGMRRKNTGKVVITEELSVPGPERVLYIGDAFAHGFSLEEVRQLTYIDPWFLVHIQDIIDNELWLGTQTLAELDHAALFQLKQKGFSDRRLATLLGTSEKDIREKRHALHIRPVYKRVKARTGEAENRTAYMYSTYDEQSEVERTDKKKIMILGGGPNRIGQGIEIDYCSVHAALALREDGYETIMVNCNPEAVSTDYDTADRLYFEPMTLEDVLEIAHLENPTGVIVQYGGQTPLKLALALEAAGVPIIGTSPDMIDAAEDRERFQQLLLSLGLRQPSNRTARTEKEAVRMAKEIGYPLVVRPSYVLGGQAMEIVHEKTDLERYMREAIKVSNDAPVLLDHFLHDAIEVDVDCLSDGRRIWIGGVIEHVEQAGVHSGDSACSLPPYSLSADVVNEIKRQTVLIAKRLNVIGLMNVQFAVQRHTNNGRQQDVIFVLEVNPRASRTVPFVSKAIGLPLAKIAARCMAGQSLENQGVTQEMVPPYFSVKEAIFPFSNFPGADIMLGPEMKSTGEVMGLGQTFGEAYFKAQLGAGIRLPEAGRAFMRIRRSDQARAVAIARELNVQGFSIVAHVMTAAVLSAAGIEVTAVDDADILEMFSRKEIALAILTVNETRSEIHASAPIRLRALKSGSVVYTTIAAADAAVVAMRHRHDTHLHSLQELHRRMLSEDGTEVSLVGRKMPSKEDAMAASKTIERRTRDRSPKLGGAPLNLFIQQPLSESDLQHQNLIKEVLQVIDSANNIDYTFNYLTGLKAESADTFKKSFEDAAQLPFTPHNFRRHRLGLLDQADVFINIRVGTSENTAFELAYHIFKGRRTPVLFLVWKHAPIKTTALREMQDLCDVTYLEFDKVDDLRRGIHHFFSTKALAGKKEIGNPLMTPAPLFR